MKHASNGQAALITFFSLLFAVDATAQTFQRAPQACDPQARNLQLALASAEEHLDSDLLAFAVSEGAQGGMDLNADGDIGDQVLHVHDFATGITTNLGLASSSSLAVAGRLVGFSVEEFAQGSSDLNGDGDALDEVFYLYDGDANTLTNLGLAGFALSMSGNLMALMVFEGQQGVMDANGDGDASDQVLFIHDIAAGVTTNSGLAVVGAVVEDSFIGFDVPETDQGFTDLNGDGDAGDFVVHVYTASTGISTNLGLDGNSPAFRTDQTLFGFVVSEIGQGGTDLNGDGDVIDGAVLHVYDAVTGSTTNLGLDVLSNPFVIFGRRIALRVSEIQQGGTDLNGDADTGDNVVHLFDASTGTMVNLGLAGEHDLSFSEELLAFRVREASQGGADLNGDGDSLDRVAHFYELATGPTTNVGLTSLFALSLDQRSIAITVRESDQSSTDFNGDGDTGDNVVHVYDSLTSTATNLALAGHNMSFKNGFLAFVVSEGFQGSTDFNGDGDTFDDIVHVHDAGTGVTTSLDLPSDQPLLGTTGLAFAVSESSQGFTDVNGDGDNNDSVLHVATCTRSPTVVDRRIVVDLP